MSFEAALKTARDSQPSAAEAAYQRAIQLYRLPFLYPLDMPWLVRRREQLKDNHVDALVGLARLYHGRGDRQRALNLLQRAQREVPGPEDIFRDILTLCREAGQGTQALAYYEALVRRLQRDLNIQPSAATRRVYQAIVDGTQ